MTLIAIAGGYLIYLLNVKHRGYFTPQRTYLEGFKLLKKDFPRDAFVIQFLMISMTLMGGFATFF